MVPCIIQVYITISVLNNFSTSDSEITTYWRLLYSLYDVFKNRIDLPVDVYRCCAAVPHTTQQRYYNEAARQDKPASVGLCTA